MKIVIVEDDEALGTTLTRRLQKQGFDVSSYPTISHHFASIIAFEPDALLLDMKLQDETSIVSIPALRDVLPAARIVVLTGYGSIATAVDAMRKGADDYLTKPAEFKNIVSALKGEQNREISVQDEIMSPDRLEWEHIQRVLQDNDGNVSQTARDLNMHRRTLQRKLQKKPVSK